MDKNFQYSIGASSFLSFNKKYFPSHEDGNQNLCHSTGGDFSTGQLISKGLFVFSTLPKNEQKSSAPVG